MLRSTGLRKSTARYDDALPMCSRCTVSSFGRRSTSIATAPAPWVGSPELPRAYSAMSALTTIAQRSSALEREIAQRVLQRVDTAQARVLDLRNLALTRERRQASGEQALVEHALHDDGAGRIVGARFRAEPEEADALRIDVVALDEPHDRRGGHRVDALRRPAHPKAVADDGPGLVPGGIGPIAPRFEIDSIWRDVHGEPTDPNLLSHTTPQEPRTLAPRAAQGAPCRIRPPGRDYRAKA